MRYRYTKYAPNLFDDLDIDELTAKLSDLLLASGFGDGMGGPFDGADRTMQALHDAILEALFNGGMLPPDLFEQLFGTKADGQGQTPQEQIEGLEELIQQIIDRMKESGYITTAPDLGPARAERARGRRP